MSEKVDNYVKKTYRYFYDDGLVELTLGLLFIVVGGMLFAWQNLGQSSLIDILLALGLVTAVIGGIYLVNRILPMLKQRVTYPRTGYVAYRKEEPGKARWLLYVSVILLVIATFFLPDAFTRMQFMVGAILAAVLIYVGYRVSLRRFYLLGAVVMLVGVVSTLAIADELLGTALVFFGAGCLLLVSGALAFTRYLRRHSQAEEEIA